jgi:hypothetical protein
VVIDGDLAGRQGWDEPFLERYLLQFWPAPTEPAAVIVSSAAWSQYLTFGADARQAARLWSSLPEPDGMIAVIDTALADHRDVAEHSRAGDDQYMSGVYRYTQEFLNATRDTGTYAAYRDHTDRSLGELILERARSGPHE